jgi:hypothetical protein
MIVLMIFLLRLLNPNFPFLFIFVCYFVLLFVSHKQVRGRHSVQRLEGHRPARDNVCQRLSRHAAHRRQAYALFSLSLSILFRFFFASFSCVVMLCDGHLPFPVYKSMKIGYPGLAQVHAYAASRIKGANLSSSSSSLLLTRQAKCVASTPMASTRSTRRSS